MKKMETSSDFILKLKKLRKALTIPISAVMLILYLSSLITVIGQDGNSGQEKPKVIPLAERIGHTDQTKAFAVAQENMVKAASEDSALLASAQQRAQKLLEGYVTNIGNVVGKEYSIKWKYIDADGHASTKKD